MTKTYLTCFYIAVCFIGLWLMEDYFRALDNRKFNLIYLAWPLNYISSAGPWDTMLYFLGIGVFLVCCFFYQRVWRIFACLFLFIFICVYSSPFYQIAKFLNIWLFVVVALCFIDTEKPLNSRWNLFCIRFMQGSFLVQFFSAGLWKVRSWFAFESWEDFKMIPFQLIARPMLEGLGGPQGYFKVLLYEYGIVIQLGYYFIVLLQLSVIIPILRPRLMSYWGALLVFFYLTTHILLSAYHFQSLLAVFFIFILSEKLLGHDQENIPTNFAKTFSK